MKVKLIKMPLHDSGAPLEEVEGKLEPRLLNSTFFPPLGISLITSHLRSNGFKVDQDDLLIKLFHHNWKSGDKIRIDLFEDKERIEEYIQSGEDSELEEEGKKLVELTETGGYDIFGLSVYDTHHPSSVGTTAVVSKILKERFDCTILVGGRIHPEAKQGLVKSDFIDYAFDTGYAHEKILNFCRAYEKNKSVENVEGLMYVDEDKLKVNDSSSKTKIIKPDFSGLPLELYSPKIFSERLQEEYQILVLPYFFIRGCPNRCAFCATGREPFGKKEPEEVVADLEELKSEYSTKYFYFLNSEVNPDYSYTEEILDRIKTHDLEIIWSDCATFHNMDKELLQKIKECGGTRLVYGLESASRRILESIDKPITLRNNEDPLKRVKKLLKEGHELGISNHLDLITGFPYEKPEDLLATSNFIKEVSPHLQKVWITKFMPQGRMRVNPERWGIKLDGGKGLAKQQNSFVEIEGLNWDRKKVITDDYYTVLRCLTQKKGIHGNTTKNEIRLLENKDKRAFLYMLDQQTYPLRWDEENKYFIGW